MLSLMVMSDTNSPIVPEEIKKMVTNCYQRIAINPLNKLLLR